MFLTRLITAVICFILLFCFFYLGGAVLIGVIVGTDTALKNEPFEASAPDVEKIKAEAKQEAETEVKSHVGAIALVAVVLSGLCSVVLAFGGLAPWCRKKPPAVPASDST